MATIESSSWSELDSKEPLMDMAERSSRDTPRQASSANTNINNDDDDGSHASGMLRELWAEILNVDEEDITDCSHFFELGGDSIAVAELSMAASCQGLEVPRHLVFEAPTFADLLVRVARRDAADEPVMEPDASEPAPFSLLAGDTELARQLAADVCGVPVGDVEDMYPATAQQAGLMARSMRMPGAYVSSWLLRDAWTTRSTPAQLCEVLEQAVGRLPILRTAMVASAEHDFAQVVLRPGAVEVVRVPSLQQFDPASRRPAMALGSPLTKIEVVVAADDEDAPALLWHAHHATYDMTSLQLVAGCVQDLASGGGGRGSSSPPPPPSYASFVAHTLRVRAGTDWRSFWSAALQDCPKPFFPPAAADAAFRTDARHVQPLPRLDPSSSCGFTPANVFRAAWALLLGDYEHAHDVVFGVTNGARYAPVPRCADIVGPTIATTPMRVRLDADDTARHLLQQVSMQAVRASAVEQAGLPDISRLGPDGRTACAFRTLLNVQTTDAGRISPLLAQPETQPEPMDYALVLELFPPRDAAARTAPLHLSYDSRALRLDQVRQIAVQIETMMGLLTAHPDRTLGELCLGAGRDVTTTTTPGLADGPLDPFQLAPIAPPRMRRHAAVACGVATSAVQDVYPSTPMQAATALTSSRHPEAHVSHHVFRARRGLGADQIKEAWAALYHWAPILRTRFFHAPPAPGGARPQLLQVVVDDEALPWTCASSLDEFRAADRQPSFTMGRPLTRLGLFREEGPDGDAGRYCVVLAAHRAVCDASSTATMLSILEGALSGVAGHVEAVPYNLFVLHTLRLSSDEAARAFWARSLHDCLAPAFPEVPLDREPLSTEAFGRAMSLPAGASPTLLQAAWAVTLAQYHDAAADVVFGLYHSICPSHAILGPTETVIPQRVVAAGGPDTTVAQLLRAMRAQHLALASFAQLGLARIEAIDESCAAACRLQSLLAIRDELVPSGGGGAFSTDPAPASDERHALPLVAEVTRHADGSVTGRLRFDPLVLKPDQARRLASHYEHVARQMRASSAARLGDLDHVPPEHMSELLAWNTLVPAPVECGVHELVEERADREPGAAAICASDGRWTFAELDADAERLARWLRTLGVTQGAHVPLVFEKCGLAIVAMLAVLKAGAASVALDPSHPPARLRDLVQSMYADGACPVVLCSASHRELAVGLARRAAIVDRETLRSLGGTSMPRLGGETRVPATATAFVLFTSGSTGRPKGILIPHRAFASSIRGHADVLRFSTGPGSRNLQFTAYTSDVSIGEIFTSLAVGSCVCVPSDWDRQNDLAGAVRRLDANWAFFTPSVATLLRPADVPGLRTMVFGGETASPENLATWAPALHLINSFGPAETSIWSHAMRRRAQPGDNGSHIGHGIGCATWIVDPDDHRRLRPIGAVGEMLVEGPNLAAGYLGEPAKTAAAFVHDAPWIPAHRQPARAYRTGDLARFLPDGSVQFLGRRDHQIKLRGLRIELGEIEHQIRAHVPPDVVVAVDVVAPRPAGSPQVLAAFLALKHTKTDTAPPDAQTQGQHDHQDGDTRRALSLLVGKGTSWDRLSRALSGIDVAVAAALPSHMVPAAFVPLREMPLTASAKTDRKALKLLASMVSAEELGRLGHAATGSRQPPSSVSERMLARLWSSALGRPLDVDVRDGFFRVGGDSLSAMRLISLARAEGLRLSVEHVFKHPSLQDMARAAVLVGAEEEEQRPRSSLPLLPGSTSRPFATLGGPEAVESAAHAASAQLGVDQAAIEDMYPCTALQEGLVALSQDARGSYVAQMVYELPPGVDVNRFKSAWAAVLEAWPILRTRFFPWHAADGTSRLMQAVVRTEAAPIRWAQARTLSDHLKLDRRDRMQTGDNMLRMAAFDDRHDGKRYFVMTIHHALYDGWMLGLLWDALRAAYGGRRVPDTVPHGAFVAHLASRRDGGFDEDFWRRYVGNAPRLSWPELPSPDFRPISRLVSRRTDALPGRGRRRDFTSTTLLRAAFAMLLGAYAHTEDVVFASTVYGRTTGGGSAERVAGPTLATLPVRVSVGREQTVRELMARIQSDAANLLAHEQAGLQTIRRLNRDGLATIDAQSLLVVQVDGGDPELAGKGGDGDDDELALRSVQVSRPDNGLLSSVLVVEATVSVDGLHLVATYDDRVLPGAQADRFVRQLSYIVSRLCEADDDARLADLDLAPVEDLEQMRQWNPAVPAPSRALVHELVAAEARRQPDAEALVSRAGSLTYQQLEDASSRLAHHLWAECGLRPGDRVPLLFEKSIWAVVAMLAVLKTGAANVALDPAQPPAQLRSLVADVDAQLVLCSPASRLLAQNMATTSHFCVDAAAFSPEGGGAVTARRSSSDRLAPDLGPESLAFLLFTSGSTGRPKAVMIDHAAFCSSMAGHAETLRYRRGSRNLQFTAYTSDVSIGEIFTSLGRGATVCVPSEAERMGDLAGAMERMRVDWAFLTPSVAALLDPEQVPTLRTLLFGGETATPTNVRAWAPRLHLINSFGPAETSIWSHAHPGFAPDDDGTDIGRPLGCATWIVDPHDAGRLMPVGAVGELVVEGPNVAAGYYHSPDKTRAAFPASLPCIPHRGHRIYRTGDLARWMSDGRVQFLGRADGQVKLHGLKVDVGEVEHAIRAVVGAKARDQPDAFHGVEVAVELVRCPGPSEEARLVAFVGVAGGRARDVTLVTDESGLARFAELTAGLRDKLMARLAPYTIPAFFVPLTRMPLTASAKTDRRFLRSLVADRGFAALARFSLASRSEVRPPETPVEKRLHALWSAVLALPPDDFGVEADFFDCGGDSIAAMRLASAAHAAQLSLTVQDIYDHPRLSDMAAAAMARQHHDGVPGNGLAADASAARRFENPAPFSLLPSFWRPGPLVNDLARACSIEPSQVEDVYPCTPTQRSFVARTAARPGSFWLQNVFDVPDDVDAARLDRAWQRLVARHDVLRTRILPHQDHLLQVVLRFARQPIRVVQDAAVGLPQFLAAERPQGPAYGHPLVRIALVAAGEAAARRQLVLTVHHAVFDAWSLSRMFAELERHYVEPDAHDGHTQPVLGFNAFVKRVLAQDRAAALAFWTDYLGGAQTKPFAASQNDSQPRCLLRHSIALPAAGAVSVSGVTHAVTTYAAVALALKQQVDAPDTMLRLVSSGRTAPGLDGLIGPTVTTVPLRVSHDAAGDSLAEYLAHVHAQVRRVAPFEQTGSDVDSLGPDASRVCRGMPQLIVHPFDPYKEQPAARLGLRRRELSAVDNNADSPFTVDVSLETQGRGRQMALVALHLRVVFDDAAVSEHAARRFVAHLDVMVRRMASAQPDAVLSTLQRDVEKDAMVMDSQMAMYRVGDTAS